MSRLSLPRFFRKRNVRHNMEEITKNYVAQARQESWTMNIATGAGILLTPLCLTLLGGAAGAALGNIAGPIGGIVNGAIGAVIGLVVGLAFIYYLGKAIYLDKPVSSLPHLGRR